MATPAKLRLPKHFSIISAQTSPVHDEARHGALASDLIASGMRAHEAHGHYTDRETGKQTKEKSFMVEHSGSKEDRAKVEKLGAKHSQQSVLHSSPVPAGKGQSIRRNELHFMDGKTAPIVGHGYKAYSKRPTEDHTHLPATKHNFALDLESPGPAEQAKGAPMKKADLMHQDGQSLSGDSRMLASMSTPDELKAWGEKTLSPLDKDAICRASINGSVVKVRKMGPDLYSGWVEKGDEIKFKFSRLTMPELMSQLQSQLELYGKEAQAASTSQVESQAGGTDEGKKPETSDTDVLKDPSAKPEAKPADEADRQAEIREKLESLRAKVKGEVIPAAQLQDGLDDPEKECPACEEPVEDCQCYQGLSSPRVEFDGRKLTIFFKSDWSGEDRDNFKEDLKRRAGVVLKKSMQARSRAVESAKKLVAAAAKKR